MSRARLIQAALLLCTVALPSRALCAQKTLVATARLMSRPLTLTGADSGKVLVKLKVSGIPEVALRVLKLDQLLLLDKAGRAYTPWGVGFAPRKNEIVNGKVYANPLAEYTRPVAERLADREYLYLVAPGSLTFELRVANMKPVRVDASLVGSGR